MLMTIFFGILSENVTSRYLLIDLDQRKGGRKTTSNFKTSITHEEQLYFLNLANF